MPLLLALAPMIAWHVIRQTDAHRAWILPGLAAAAFLSVLGPGSAIWLVLTMVPLLVAAWRRLGRSAAIGLALKSAAVAVVATLPLLITPNGLYNPFGAYLFEETELGNLSEPLSIQHVMGIWPAEDFRLDAEFQTPITILAIVFAGLGLFAAYRAIKDRELALPAYALGGAIAFALTFAVSSPWIDGKAMAIVSPALLTAGLAGAVLLVQRTSHNIEGWLLTALAAGLILYTSFLFYQGAWLAPRDEHRELERIGEQFEGEGPALMTEGSDYAGRHFLRKLDAESAKDLRRSTVPLSDGSAPDEVPYLDTDMFDAATLAPYRLLVFRRSPVVSRPPGDFRLAEAGTYYEVWERFGTPVAGKSLIERLPLGEPPDNSAVPDCAQVEALASNAGPNATLVAARPGEQSLLDLSGAAMPASWRSDDDTTFSPVSSGTLEVGAPVPVPGDYRVWIGGDIHGELEVSVAGETAPGVRNAINVNRYEPFGPFALDAGEQTISIRYDGAGLAPGSGAAVTPLGPVFLERVQPDDRGTVTVAASQYQRLCDEPWDWIEAYG